MHPHKASHQSSFLSSLSCCCMPSGRASNDMLKLKPSRRHANGCMKCPIMEQIIETLNLLNPTSNCGPNHCWFMFAPAKMREPTAAAIIVVQVRHTTGLAVQADVSRLRLGPLATIVLRYHESAVRSASAMRVCSWQWVRNLPKILAALAAPSYSCF